MKRGLGHLLWIVIGVLLGAAAGQVWKWGGVDNPQGTNSALRNPAPGAPAQNAERPSSSLPAVTPPDAIDLATAGDRITRFHDHHNPVLAEVELGRSLVTLAATTDDPAALVALFAHSPHAGATRDFVKLTFSQLAARDPVRAIELVDEVTNIDLKNAALEGAFKTWAEADADAALEFVSGLDKGFTRDHASRVVLGQLAKQLFQDDPEGAMERAGALSDETFRKGLYGNILQLWKERDIEGAFHWRSEEHTSELQSP